MTADLHRDEVTPLPKQTRVWNCRKGVETCTYKKPCPSCLGRRNRRSGLKKQREARKALGIPPAKVASVLSNEEGWRDPHFRDEVKSGAQTKPAATRFLAAEKQADANKAIGDFRDFRHVLMPPDWGSEGLVQVRLSTWRKIIRPALDAYWSDGEGA